MVAFCLTCFDFSASVNNHVLQYPLIGFLLVDLKILSTIVKCLPKLEPAFVPFVLSFNGLNLFLG